MPIPFGLAPEQFSAHFRGLLEKNSPSFMLELTELFEQPIGPGVISANIEVFLDESGEFAPKFGMYFDGTNKKVDHQDQSIFPGRHLPLAAYLDSLPGFHPKYFQEDDFRAVDIQGDICKEWFAEWWWKAGGWYYPIEVEITVHDDFGDGNGILLAPGQNNVERG